MQPEDFRRWRATLGLKKVDAAKILDVSATTIDQYETGIRRGVGTPAHIPHVVALACSAILHGIPAYGSKPGIPME